ncbi:MAG: molybdopterin-dependent oxidoreductase [Pseudonocardiales bacterium]|nr:molybdopterin-dependent oxidoreductase [Pseudonocardiales bacterium]MBV9031939.1 molybdopterin-dependent oxidoreductase [Pseudonocardiales bacterium]
MTSTRLAVPVTPAPVPRLSLAVAALVGLLSMAAGLATGHLVGGFISPTASPFLAVGGSAIDLTPLWLKDFAVRTFGSDDKVVLLSGMAVVIGLAGVVAGLLSRRSRTPGLVLILVLGVVAGIAVLCRPTAGPLDVLAPLAALLAGAGVFATLHRLGRLSRQPAAGGATEVSRRRLLVGSAAVAAGAAVAATGGQLLTGRGAVEASRQTLGRIVPTVPAPPIPRGADFAADGSPSFITPNRDFYRVDVNLVLPQLRAEDWRLRIHGMVDREVTLTWSDLTSRSLVERPVTMTCVSNELGGPYISTSHFTGVLLADILHEVGVRRGADQVFTTSVDGWTCGTPTATLTDPGRQAMLVIGMNREPLPIEHGFPVRMLVPGLYGFVSGTKWITDMELTTFDARRAYWLQRGWGQRAPIKTMSRIDSPRPFARVSPDTPITGVAWAQTRGIESVEVRLDHGEWRPAELSTEVNVDTWRMFRLRGRWAPGAHVVEVRATDRTGYTQTVDRVAPIPDGASGWDSARFTVL